MKNILFCFIIILFLFSCTDPLKITPSDSLSNIMTLNATFRPDDSWKLTLIKTKTPYDSLSYESIHDASIFINDNTKPNDFKFIYPKTTFDLGYYYNHHESKNIDKSIHVYEIEILKDGYPSIFAKDTIPTKPIISHLNISETSVEEIFSPFPNSKKRYLVSGIINFRIQNFDKKNKYQVKVFLKEDYTQDITGNIKDTIYFSEAYLTFLNLHSGIIFNSFDGQDLNSNHNEVSISISKNTKNQNKEPKEIILEISTLSNNYFSYLKNIYDIQKFNQNPFSQPITPFSNIEGGFGIFAAYNSTIDTLYL